MTTDGGEGRFLDRNSGFMYASHYEMGPPPRLSRRAIRARGEGDDERLARMQREYAEAYEKVQRDWVLAMTYWVEGTEDGTLPMSIRDVERLLSEAGWIRRHHFFTDTAQSMSQSSIIKVC
jgi:hypothetical protein